MKLNALSYYSSFPPNSMRENFMSIVSIILLFFFFFFRIHSCLYKMNSSPPYLIACFYINFQSIFKTECYIARMDLLFVSHKLKLISNHSQKQKGIFKSNQFISNYFQKQNNELFLIIFF